MRCTLITFIDAPKPSQIMVGVSPAGFWATMVPKVRPFTSLQPPAKKVVVETAGGKKPRTVYRRDETVYRRVDIY